VRAVRREEAAGSDEEERDDAQVEEGGSPLCTAIAVAPSSKVRCRVRT
jgi:hypothetical protein